MSFLLAIHPVNPQPRLARQAVASLREGSVVAYPTDSCYALGCLIGDKEAMERIRRIRDADKNHNFTLVCRDLSEIAKYARVDNTPVPDPQGVHARAVHVPARSDARGAETPAKPEAAHDRHPCAGQRHRPHAAGELGEPIMSSTLLLPGDTEPMTDPHEIKERLEHQVDLVIDGGHCGFERAA